MIDWHKNSDSYQERFDVLDQFNTSQISVTNTSNSEQWIKLWGANKGEFVNYQSRFLKTGSYPQAIAINPVNNFIYVVNQLAASLQVFNLNDELIGTVRLDEKSIPTASPVAIDVNPINGDAYIIGSLSDMLYVVDVNLKLTESIQLQNRPVSVSYCDSNQSIYVHYLIGTSISIVVVNEGYSVNQVETNGIQKELVVNEVHGTWLVLSIDGKSIKEYDLLNRLQKPSSFENRQLKHISIDQLGVRAFAIDEKTNELVIISLISGEVLKSASLEGGIISLQLIENGLVATTVSPNRLIKVDGELNVLQSISISSLISKFVYNQTSNSYYLIEDLKNKVSIIADKTQSIAKYSDNYKMVLADLQHQPVLLKHLKVFYSGTSSRPFIKVGSKSSSGKEISRLVSLLKYNSPQHFSSIYNVTELDKEIIDGRTFWEVLVPPEQSMTLVLYHS